MPALLHLYLSLTLLLPSLVPLTHAQSASSVTIDQLPAYSLQRHCGKGCLQNNYDGGDDVEDELGCTWNACYCGTQYQPAVTSIISKCWSEYCGTTLFTGDIASALSIYGDYCGQALGAAFATTTTDSGAGGQTSASTSGLPTTMATQVTFQSDTMITAAATTTAAGSGGASVSSQSTTSQSQGGGLSLSDRIALGVGLGLGIPTLIVTIIMCIMQAFK